MKRSVYMVVVLAMFFLFVSGCGGDDSSNKLPDWLAWFGIGEGGSWPWDDMDDMDFEFDIPYYLTVELSITDENDFVIPDFVEISLYTTLYTENCGSFIYSGTPLLSRSPDYYPQEASTDNFWTYKQNPTAFVKLRFRDWLPNSCGTYADGDITITVDHPGYAIASTTYIFYLEPWPDDYDPETTIYLQLVPEVVL